SLMQQGDALVIAVHELTESDRTELAKAAAVVVLSTVMPAGMDRADVVLPIANIAEEEGTLTNLRGRVQRYLQARAAPGLARPAWYTLVDLAALLGDRLDVMSPDEVFASLAASHSEFAGMTYDGLGLRGQLVASAAQPAGAA
ncbi:MAG TPA: molybdopterin-dependent oxidoreductase, partial [Gemmatimonadaceae bacterium]